MFLTKPNHIAIHLKDHITLQTFNSQSDNTYK